MNENYRVLTCVYCGKEYPQGTPRSGSEILTAHIEVCEKHPLHAARYEIKILNDMLDKYMTKCAHYENTLCAVRNAKHFIHPDGIETLEITTIGKLFAKLEDMENKYNELIMCVGNIYPNETRHETALRYLKLVENTNIGDYNDKCDS